MPNSEANPLLDKLEEIASLLRQLVATERPKPQRLLRLTEAAHYLHISVGQLRGLVQRGELDVVPQSAGSRIPWLVDRTDLDHWIEKSKVNRG
jgi:excisionase family DNA binding protein